MVALIQRTTIATMSSQRAVIDAVEIAQTPAPNAMTPITPSNIEVLPFVGEPRVQVTQPSSSSAPAAQRLLEPISHTLSTSGSHRIRPPGFP